MDLNLKEQEAIIIDQTYELYKFIKKNYEYQFKIEADDDNVQTLKKSKEKIERLLELHSQYEKNLNQTDNDSIDILNANSIELRKSVLKSLKDMGNKRLVLDDIGEPYFDKDGWDCESNENLITKCVYIYEPIFDGETCIYCGEPEERQ